MADDRFERALFESDATRLITDAGADIQDERDRKILDDWALSIASQLAKFISVGEHQLLSLVEDLVRTAK